MAVRPKRNPNVHAAIQPPRVVEVPRYKAHITVGWPKPNGWSGSTSVSCTHEHRELEQAEACSERLWTQVVCHPERYGIDIHTAEPCRCLVENGSYKRAADDCPVHPDPSWLARLLQEHATR